MPGSKDAFQRGNSVYIDPDLHPTIMTDHGPQAATSLGILSHELGHLTGSADDGPGRMNNVNAFENPITAPITGSNRTQYPLVNGGSASSGNYSTGNGLGGSGLGFGFGGFSDSVGGGSGGSDFSFGVNPGW